MKDRKTWIKAIVSLGSLTLIISAFFLYQWNHFIPIAMNDYTKRVKGETIEESAALWIESYMEQYDSILVPFSMRVKDITIDHVEALSKPNFFQVDYTLYTSSTNWQIAGNMEAMEVGHNTYTAQRVLQFGQDKDGYYALANMRPVEYQIQYELGPPVPQQPTYAMDDKEDTFLLQEETLMVTYDYGKSYVDVPISYEDITRSPLSSYQVNLLQEGSYIVSKEYTAFLYVSEDRSLWAIVSFDQGSTWQDIRIIDNVSARVKYISKTDSYVYVMLASDKAMSAEGHVLLKSEDGIHFTMVQDFQDPQTRIMTYATFLQDDVGYVAYTKRNYADDREHVVEFYRSEDGGKNFTQITLPKHEVTFMDYTYEPFVQVERIYQENGKIHVLVNQGDNGDYGTNGGLYKAHFESEDGYQFTFIEEVIDEPVLAG